MMRVLCYTVFLADRYRVLAPTGAIIETLLLLVTPSSRLSTDCTGSFVFPSPLCLALTQQDIERLTGSRIWPCYIKLVAILWSKVKVTCVCIKSLGGT